MSMMPFDSSTTDLILTNIFGFFITRELYQLGEISEEDYKNALYIAKNAFSRIVEDLKVANDIFSEMI